MMSILQAPCSVGNLWKVLEFRGVETTVLLEKDLPCFQEQKGLKGRKAKDTGK